MYHHQEIVNYTTTRINIIWWVFTHYPYIINDNHKGKVNARVIPKIIVAMSKCLHVLYRADMNFDTKTHLVD